MGEDTAQEAGRLIPHLHLHLEPEERKRSSFGLVHREYTDRHVFFGSHDLAAPDRINVVADDLATFIRDVHAEQRTEGVGYVELRLSPRRFLSDGVSWEEFFRITDGAMSALREPAVRAVLLVNRDSSPDFLDQCHQRISGGLPPTYVGVDLAGDEVRFPDRERFRTLFQLARATGLGVTVHAGEFGGADQIWGALDELGAQRIGHGVSAATSRSLLKRLADDRILIESSIGSNVALGVVADAVAHPFATFLEHSVPVCLNVDIPCHTGHTMPAELALAARTAGLSMREITEIQISAYRCVFDRVAEPDGA